MVIHPTKNRKLMGPMKEISGITKVSGIHSWLSWISVPDYMALFFLQIVWLTDLICYQQNHTIMAKIFQKVLQQQDRGEEKVL